MPICGLSALSYFDPLSKVHLICLVRQFVNSSNPCGKESDVRFKLKTPTQLTGRIIAMMNIITTQTRWLETSSRMNPVARPIASVEIYSHQHTHTQTHTRTHSQIANTAKHPLCPHTQTNHQSETLHEERTHAQYARLHNGRHTQTHIPGWRQRRRRQQQNPHGWR